MPSWTSALPRYVCCVAKLVWQSQTQSHFIVLETRTNGTDVWMLRHVQLAAMSWQPVMLRDTGKQSAECMQ